MYQPPLVQACFHGDAAELRTLISRREDVNLQVNKKNFNLKLCKLIFSTLFCLIFVRAPENNFFHVKSSNLWEYLIKYLQTTSKLQLIKCSYVWLIWTYKGKNCGSNS